MKLENNKNGDYFIPKIALWEQSEKPLGKYGRIRRTYLQEHRKAVFNHLVLSEKLFPHLNEVDEQAQHLLETIISAMAKVAGITEQLKSTDQMRWLGSINAIKAQVEEIIFTELRYCYKIFNDLDFTKEDKKSEEHKILFIYAVYEEEKAWNG